ncbi:MAG TPA: Uma2 family endonuclease [Tepidisphaeraceae bacterium]|nr:Uma2 family endonuclease [Tepidisphaeraceae bacterium]
MPLHATHSRRFLPGTTGWTEDALDDPRIERLWAQGRFEIVEGVLTKMPAAYLEGSLPLRRLVRQIENHLNQTGTSGEFGFEMDLVINRIRVSRVDAAFLTPGQLARQMEAQARLPKRTKLRYGRLRVAPELVIESASPGHELHDRQVKREWYRGFGIPNYWMLDPYRKTLECLRLADGDYQTDVARKDTDEVAPKMFSGLSIQLGKVWI